MDTGGHPYQKHVDEEAFWAEMQNNQEQERREYEERVRQQRGAGAPLTNVAEGIKGLMRAVATNTGTPQNSGGARGSHGPRPPMGLEMSASGSQFHYRMMDDAEDEREERGGWAPVANLDVFFHNMYKYYRNKGFGSIVAAGATNLISMAFTVALSTWLLAFVDWTKLTTCNDEDSCQPLDSYIHWEALYRPSHPRYSMVWIYCALFCLYWCASCYWFFITVKDAAEMHSVYKDRLGISTRELVTIEWHEVVARLLAKQCSGEYRVSINKDLTAHDIASRIMRRENFLIALFNLGILDLRLRLPFIGSKNRGSWFASTEQQFLTRNLEWSLHICILNDMFNDKFTLRRDFLADEEGLRRRFMIVGLLQLALMPFLLIFMVVQFFLQNAQEWHSKKNYLGPRQWSPLAQWKFREYNELPHILERRLNNSYPFAMEYQKQAPAPVLAVVARCCTYVSGSVVAVLLLFTLIDESILLYVKLADRNLLWYVGIFSALFAMSRSLVPGMEDYMCDHEQTMHKIAAHTHYFPPHWKGKCHTYEVRQDFLQLFQYKTAIFQQEVLSAIITPVILCFSLTECTHTILDFIKEHHQHVEGLGSVCSFSLFDLERFGSPSYGSTVTPPPTQPSPPSENGRGPLLHRPPRPLRWYRDNQDGKVEKSLINFKVNYPEWDSGAQGKALMSRLQSFQHDEMEKEASAVAAMSGGTGAGTGLPICASGLTHRLGSGPLYPAGTFWGGPQMLGGYSMASANPLSSSMWHPQQQQQLHDSMLMMLAGPRNGLAYEMESSFYWLERYAEQRLLKEQRIVGRHEAVGSIPPPAALDKRTAL